MCIESLYGLKYNQQIWYTHKYLYSLMYLYDYYKIIKKIRRVLTRNNINSQKKEDIHYL